MATLVENFRNMIRINAVILALASTLFSVTAMAQTQNFEMITGFDNIERIVGEYGKEVTNPDEQLEFNSALVFHLTEEYTLVTTSEGTKAVLFKDPEDFRQAVARQSFPDPGRSSVFAADAEKMLTLNRGIDDFLERLAASGCRVDVEAVNNSSLDDLSSCISKFGRNNITDSIYIAAGIVFGEIIRKELKAKWDITKEFDLNPYYIPHLVLASGKRIYFFKRFHEHWHRKAQFNFQKLKEDILKYEIKGYFGN